MSDELLANLKIGLIILLTGIVVVFSVLVLLIIIIKIYSTAVSNAQSKIEQRKIEKIEVLKKSEAPSAEEKPESAEKIEPEEDDTAIPGEIIAVIAAAVDTVFGQGAVAIKSVKRAKPAVKRRNAWRAAGMAENTRAF